MTIDVLSDIHLDFWVSPKLNDVKQSKRIERFVEKTLCVREGAELLFIAGDIGHYNRQNRCLLHLLSERYRHLFVTWGNHDLYLLGNSALKKYRDSLARLGELKRICESFDNVTFLDGDVVRYGRLRIWGSGLWYRVEETAHWRSVMNDASQIVFDDGYRDVDFDEYGRKIVYRFDPLALYKREIEKLESVPAGVDVVMTHIPPMLPEEVRESWASYYRFDGERYVSDIAPRLWVFGHLHRAFDFRHGVTRLIGNPLGYPDEEDGAFEIKRVEIEENG